MWYIRRLARCAHSHPSDASTTTREGHTRRALNLIQLRQPIASGHANATGFKASIVQMFKVTLGAKLQTYLCTIFYTRNMVFESFAARRKVQVTLHCVGHCDVIDWNNIHTWLVKWYNTFQNFLGTLLYRGRHHFKFHTAYLNSTQSPLR